MTSTTNRYAEYATEAVGGRGTGYEWNIVVYEISYKNIILYNNKLNFTNCLKRRWPTTAPVHFDWSS